MIATAAAVAGRPPVDILADALVRIGPAKNLNEAEWTSAGSLIEASSGVTLQDAEDTASYNMFPPWGAAYRFW